MQIQGEVKHDPQMDQIETRDVINLIQNGVYYTHLFVVFIYSCIMLTIFPRLIAQFSSGLILIIVYGFMMVWIILTVLICVCLKRVKTANFCVRIVSKFVIMSFPIFCAIASIHTNFVVERSVETFMIYHLIVSAWFVIYEIYSCTCGHHNYPYDLTYENDLEPHRGQIQRKRKEYFDHRIKKMASAPPA